MITKDREYRSFQLKTFTRSETGESSNDQVMGVEGYAAVFDTPTLLYTDENGIDFHEVIDAHAFDEVDLSDVVMNFNHGGKPVARTKNKTLTLGVDAKGLLVSASLGGTEEGRRLHEEIEGGYLDKMSFSFDIAESFFDTLTNTRRITKVSRLYDVAVVDFPAYETTSVYARNRLSAEADGIKAEALRLKRKRLKIKTKSKNLKGAK